MYLCGGNYECGIRRPTIRVCCRVTLILHGVLESLAPKLYAHVMCIYQKGVNKHMVINKHGLKQEQNWKVAMKVQDYGCIYIYIY